MKVSMKLLDQDHHQNHHNDHHAPPLLLRAKVPITILNLPFLSHFSTTTAHPSHLSLSLSTNFSSGPSLKLSYATTSSAAGATSTPPLSLTLKSGTGLFGSPNNSPLVISANFSFNPSNPNNPNPTFSLLFKPQLGSFSLRKSTCSHSKPDVRSESTNGDAAGFDSNSFGFVPLEKPADIKDLSLEKMEKYSIFKGIQLAANTHMPVAKRAALKCKWRMDFPMDKMPVLRINKIGIERAEEAVKEDDERKRKNDGSVSEVEMLKGMCFWMKRELDSLAGVNKELKYELAEMKAGRLARNDGGSRAGDAREGDRNKAMPAVGRSSGGFEHWKSKKENGNVDNGNANRKKEGNKIGSVNVDVENEFQRAIKAASGSS